MADTSRAPPPHIGYSPVKRGRMHGGYNGSRHDGNLSGAFLGQNSLISAGKDEHGVDGNQYNQKLLQPKGEWTLLDIQERGLRRLSPRLATYKFLTGLYLGKNNFEEMPAVLFQLHRTLVLLDMSDNKISVIPHEIGSLVRLKMLQLSNNNLSALPAETGRLWRLETLGISGNPFDEFYAGLVHKEGPLSMLKTLLERTKEPTETINRSWFTNVEGAKFAGKKGATREGFTVFCYNILCDRYCTKELYGYSPSWALDWNYRKKKILDEIKRYEGDIVCLQEVEMGQFKQYFAPELASSNYEGRCRPKSRARNMSEEGQSHVDGCAIFWKKDRFKLLQEYFIEFSALASTIAHNLPKDQAHSGEDFINRVQTKDNICLATLLESTQTGLTYLIANAHIHWDPEFCDVKVIQSGLMLNELKSIMRGLPVKPALVLCGDFNSMPDSGVYQYLAEGQIARDHKDIVNRHYGNYITQGLRHPFHLRSTYASWGERPFTKELLPFTNYTVDFEGVIDYIWYDADVLCVTKVLEGFSEQTMQKTGHAPNPHFPSDHFSLVCEIRRKA